MNKFDIEQYWFEKWAKENSADASADSPSAEAFKRGVLLGKWLSLWGTDGGGWPGTERHNEFAAFSREHGFCSIALDRNGNLWAPTE